jgi:phosphocarrier protein
MSSASIDSERSVQICNKYGLHARPAAEFVKRANGFKSDVWVRKDETEVNGKSIMGMMMLSAECGSEIVIRATGADAAQAVETLAALVQSGFGEELGR